MDQDLSRSNAETTPVASLGIAALEDHRRIAATVAVPVHATGRQMLKDGSEHTLSL